MHCSGRSGHAERGIRRVARIDLRDRPRSAHRPRVRASPAFAAAQRAMHPAVDRSRGRASADRRTSLVVATLRPGGMPDLVHRIAVAPGRRAGVLCRQSRDHGELALRAATHLAGRVRRGRACVGTQHLAGAARTRRPPNAERPGRSDEPDDVGRSLLARCCDRQTVAIRAKGRDTVTSGRPRGSFVRGACGPCSRASKPVSRRCWVR